MLEYLCIRILSLLNVFENYRSHTWPYYLKKQNINFQSVVCYKYYEEISLKTFLSFCIRESLSLKVVLSWWYVLSH